MRLFFKHLKLLRQTGYCGIIFIIILDIYSFIQQAFIRCLLHTRFTRLKLMIFLLLWNLHSSREKNNKGYIYKQLFKKYLSHIFVNCLEGVIFFGNLSHLCPISPPHFALIPFIKALRYSKISFFLLFFFL